VRGEIPEHVRAARLDLIGEAIAYAHRRAREREDPAQRAALEAAAETLEASFREEQEAGRRNLLEREEPAWIECAARLVTLWAESVTARAARSEVADA